jgi:hypothetical protein
MQRPVAGSNGLTGRRAWKFNVASGGHLSQRIGIRLFRWTGADAVVAHIFSAPLLA